MRSKLFEMMTPVTSLQPRWVEFTDTKGVLRCLRPGDDTARAKGVVVLCPTCKSDRNKRHYNIFLFPDAPVAAKPHGRFVLDWQEHQKKLREFKSFETLTLYEQTGKTMSSVLCPRDVCGWHGTIQEGMVHF